MNFFAPRRPPPTEIELLREYGPLREVSLRALNAPKPASPPPVAQAPLAPVRISDFTPAMWGGRRLTPDQVRATLEQAVAGNLAQQWALIDMMEDTWPRLTKNLNEVKRAAARTSYHVQPYADRGAKPTASALERAALVECALHNWRPRVGTLELSFEDALYNALDAMGKGLSALEVSWQRHEDGLLPRCAHFLHPSKYGWNAEGNELGLTQVSGFKSQDSSWSPFPPGQFWVGVWGSRSGAPGQTALLRCLAPYWCGVTFGWEWLLNNAQIFGVPLRWATYDPAQPQLLGQISSMLANLGAAGWAAFPQGTTLDFKEAVQRATDNPQVLIQTMADKACDLLILGQEASSESKSGGLGNGASELHGAVRDDRLQAAAQWCADLLNYQLVPAVLRWNWGDESEAPIIVSEIATDTDPKAKADRDQVLIEMGLKLPVKYLYERHDVPAPEDGEDTIGGSAQVSGLPPQGGPSSESAAPGSPSDAGTPETADPCQTDSAGGKPAMGSKTATQASNRPSVDSPESAVALAKSSGTAAPVLPGDYQMPAATRKALAAARARDFAPLRKVAAPLLVAIEAGELGVIGELEAFIAHLDAEGPRLVGGLDLANALEAALAEAAITGAAGTYAKLPAAK